jgi:N-acylneuraminate cytidylyltransferase
MAGEGSTFAFIPAKTCSVGLPYKLFRKIGPHSLIEWTILAAIKSCYIDVIFVSSNDPFIKEVVDRFAKRVKPIYFIRRPDELCTATSKTEEAISHLLSTNDLAKKFDNMIMLQATSPARRNNLIDSCFNKLGSSGADSLLTVSSHTPFFWIAAQNQHSYLDKYNPYLPTYDLVARPMRQELSEKDMYYHDNGNIYITKIKSFLDTKCRVSGHVEVYPTQRFESMQIDTQEDLDIMTSLYEYYGTFL